MNLLLLLSEAPPGFEWERWVGEGVAVLLVIVFLGFLLRAMPTWKEIKMKEFDVRSKEAETSGQVAVSLVHFADAQNRLADTLGQLGTTVKDIAIEQKKATDNVLILQRMNSAEANSLSETVDYLAERVDSMEGAIKDSGTYANRPKAVKNS